MPGRTWYRKPCCNEHSQSQFSACTNTYKEDIEFAPTITESRELQDLGPRETRKAFAFRLSYL